MNKVEKYKKYLEQVENLQSEVFVYPHQATIDMLENVCEELHDWFDRETVPFETLLGSLEYKVDRLLEVMNPEFEEDVNALKKLLDILRL